MSKASSPTATITRRPTGSSTASSKCPRRRFGRTDVGLSWVAELVWLTCVPLTQGKVGMPRSYPPEFRRKVLDLLKAGRKVAQVAEDLQ